MESKEANLWKIKVSNSMTTLMTFFIGKDNYSFTRAQEVRKLVTPMSQPPSDSMMVLILCSAGNTVSYFLPKEKSDVEI